MVQTTCSIGDLQLKSGHKSPFFMNAGAYVTGEQLLARDFIMLAVATAQLDFDVVWLPHYKAFLFPVITAMGINELYGKTGSSTAPTEKKQKNHS